MKPEEDKTDGHDQGDDGELAMTNNTPVETKNLDGYGNPPLQWERVLALLEQAASTERGFFLGTVDAHGKPHAAGIGALWFDGELWFVSGPGTRKSRNLAHNPVCTICAKLEGFDLVLEGEAERVTDRSLLERGAERYRAQGWPAEVDDEGEGLTAPYSAPAAGPPPWYLYRLRIHTAFGTAGSEPHGASRWRFAE